MLLPADHGVYAGVVPLPEQALAAVRLRHQTDVVLVNLLAEHRPLMGQTQHAAQPAEVLLHIGRIVAPAHDGRTGNPCIFPREFFPELCQLQGDVGGKRVIKAHLDRLLTVEVAPDALFDCDTPEALAELRRTAE